MQIAMVAAADYETDARIRRQAEALVQRGDDVTVFVLGDRPRTGRVVRDGVNVVRLPVSKYRGASRRMYLSGYLRFAFLTFWHLTKRPRSFDLIEVHSMPEALVLCALVPRLLGVPVLLDVHDLTSELFAVKFPGSRWLAAVRRSERWAMRLASETITVHDAYATVIRAAHGDVVGQLRTVLNSPDEERFTDRRWREWGDDDVCFSFHGTLVHRYGVLSMVEAFRRVREELPGARLQVIGYGDARPELVITIERLGVGEAVELSPGAVPVDEMPHLIGEAHIGLAPNLLNDFTKAILPTKVLEYVALGMPVIASRLPVLCEYFDENAIYYVTPGDVDALAEAMIATARDPDAARLRASRALEQLERIRWSRQRAIYLAVIDELAAPSR